MDAIKQAGRALLLLFLGLSATAQDSDIARVIIPLTASGSHNRPTTVSVESLVITDQRTKVSGASLLPGTDYPVELGVLIDTSDSQRSAHVDDIVKAMVQFLPEAIRGPEDRAFLMSFDATAHGTEWLTREQLQKTSFHMRIGGATALYDAVVTACKQRMGTRDWRKPTRRALVLVGDGDDNMSHMTRDEALAEALRSGAMIFTVDTEVSDVSTKGEKTMEYLAKLTGGESFSHLGQQDIPKAFASIGERMNTMYFLTYVPPDASNGGTHEVEGKPAPRNKFDLSYARTYFWNP